MAKQPTIQTSSTSSFYQPYLDKIKKFPSTPGFFPTIAGGVLIGVSATENFLMQGRITGLSGMFNTIVTLNRKSGLHWKLPFISGMLLTTYGVYYLTGNSFKYGNNTIKLFDEPAELNKDINNLGFAVGGFLVGIGTKLGNGCTSGHGVCGLGRLSKRSFAAVIVFMGTGMLVATLRDQSKWPFMEKKPIAKKQSNKTEVAAKISTASAIEMLEGSEPLITNEQFTISRYAILGTLTSGSMYYLFRKTGVPAGFSLLQGPLFGIGLMLSGMCQRSKINSFLTLNENWDPSLAFVMLGAVGVTLLGFQTGIRIMKKPIFSTKFDLPSSSKIDFKLISGAAIFGAGWGLSGLCPGPGMVNMLVDPNVLCCFIPALAAGQISTQAMLRIITRH